MLFTIKLLKKLKRMVFCFNLVLN